MVFFKLMLIGYLENLCSDRRIVSMAKMRLDMLYFIGYDIDEPLPWHSTLSRTRQLYGEELFGKLFKKVLGQCIDKGMVAGKRQAMDSIAVQANASMDSLRKKEVLDDSGYYAEQLDQGEGQSVPAKGGIKHISNSIDRRGPVSNHDSYSATDKDAKVSVKPGKTRRLNYLAQVSVDTSHHVITHVQSEHADKKDSLCLPRLLSNTVDNLKEQGCK